MATFFGDVTFASSRAIFEEDEEEEEYERPTISLTVSPSLDTSIIKQALISCGALTNAFLQDEVTGSSVEVGTVNADEVTVCHLYVSDSTLVALCQDGTDRCHMSHDVATKLLSLITPTCDVTVITSQHISKLKGAADDYANSLADVSGVTKFVTTATYRGSVKASPLPQPATIENLPAAVLTLCAMRKYSCIVYVCYVETVSVTDTDSICDDMRNILGKKGGGRKAKKVIAKRGPETIPDIYI